MPDDYGHIAEAAISAASRVSEAFERVTNSLLRLSWESAKYWRFQSMRYRVYTMPRKRNQRRRQMNRAIDLMERSMKRWEVL